jgi:hypothetical protein
VDFTYMTQPPKRYTFEQPRLKQWVESWCSGRVLNLFAGRVLLDVDETRVDMDPEMPAQFHMDAQEMVEQFIHEGVMFDTIVLDPPYCYDPETEVLTQNGWKYFYSLGESDKIATLNGDGFMEYHHPVSIIEQEYNGRMIKIKSGAIDLMVTPNHNLYVKKIWRTNPFEFYSADSIDSGIEFKCDTKWRGEYKEYFTLPSVEFSRHNRYNQKSAPEKDIKMDTWLNFLGIYLAEGCSDRGGTDYRVRIAQTIPEKRSIIEKWLDDLGYKYQKEKNGYTIYNKQLHKYVSQFGDTYNNFIPGDIKNLCPDQLMILINSMMLGDGTIVSDRKYNKKYQKFYIDNQMSYCTYSKRLADDFSEIAFKCGYRCTIRTIRSGKNNGYVVCFGKHRVTPSIKTRNISKYFSEAQYHGKVYCVDVENNIIYVRRNGIPCWCGNSMRKAREKYDGRYIGSFTKLKNLLPQILNNGGRIITLGFDTVGMSASRGFAKIAVCVICHNGDHNDTLGLVEEKIR